MAAGKNPIRLEEIVDGQRRTQVLSALLTLSGAVGLAVVYRDILTRKASQQRANRSLGQPDVIPRDVQRDQFKELIQKPTTK